MARQFDYVRRDGEFPFWRMALAVGVLLASVVQWSVGLVMLKLAADTASKAMRETTAQVRADSLKRQQALAHQRATDQERQREARARWG